MNKKLKIATIAVSAVMAGTMAFGMFGCTKKGGDDTNKPSVDANGKLTYTADTTVTTSIGYNSGTTGIKLKTDNKDMVGKSLMGKQWSEGDLKPAWQALQDQLKIKIDDQWTYAKESGQASANLETVKTKLDTIDIFTSNLTKANDAGTKDKNLLNLADYLDYMPNYKAFLSTSPVIQMSLLATAKGEMYVAPYFDGNDDIEKFVLLRKDIVESILDKDLPTTGDSTFASQNGKFSSGLSSTSVTAFMGSTDYTVDTTDPASLDQNGTPVFGTDKTSVTNNNTVKVKVNYTAALAAAKETGALHDALIAAKADLDTSTLTSGNIIDLMNAVLNGNMAVSGTKLINILRAYIDVAYTTEAGEQFYSTANKLKRSGVFNSACAAWDVDLYAALGRCYVASGSMFAGDYTAAANKPTYLVSGRTNDDQRQSDMYSLVGELYGVRGLESRYNYSYIDKDGKVQDAREDAKTWDAMNAFAALTKEGLVNFSLAGGDYGSSVQRGTYETLSLHDYVQTQTKGDGFKATATADKYNMAPVVTPVSKWNDGTGEKIMRFTESWRSVKTEGMAVSANVAKDPNKLAAVLAFIDYIYSSDGQILMTYGPQSTNGNTNPNGLWYATEATGVAIADVADKVVDEISYAPAQYKMKDASKKDYFIYKGKVYTGTPYNGRQIPTMTTENLAKFGETSNNFTNHARQNLGTCFPVGNKDQGFEYQCTAKCGLAGSDIVNICLNNGTIKHQYQTVDKGNYWYMLLPTALPYSSATVNALGSGDLQYISGSGGDSKTLYCKSNKQHANLFLKLMEQGYGTTNISFNNKTVDVTSATTIKAAHEALGMSNFKSLAQDAFGQLISWYDAQKK